MPIILTDAGITGLYSPLRPFQELNKEIAAHDQGARDVVAQIASPGIQKNAGQNSIVKTKRARNISELCERHT